MNPHLRPCYRHLDRPIVALWGLEPPDLFALFGLAVVLMVLTNIAVGIVGTVAAAIGLRALKAGKPRGYVFGLFYRWGILRLVPATLRPPWLVIPPGLGLGERILRFSPAPGPEDDETPEARYFRGPREFLR